MKRELKLNFGELRLVQKRVTEFQDALADIDGTAAYFDDVLGKQESEAAAVLVERHQEMAEASQEAKPNTFSQVTFIFQKSL